MPATASIPGLPQQIALRPFHATLLGGRLAGPGGLFLIGEPELAATAGLLHAIGKFGSALKPESAGGR